ncbi:MAG: glycosyltransferase family 39 protein [Actinomycetota bacterium]|nr:glycosyltransferase family 39 protein [Actinomycetota bacterium]
MDRDVGLDGTDAVTQTERATGRHRADDGRGPRSRSVEVVFPRRPAQVGWWWSGVAASAVLAALLAFIHLGRNPMWHDEVFTAFIATRPTSLLLTILAKREGNMPLYYLLMHGWAQGGTGAGWLRIPSAAAAVAAVPVTALVARRVFGDRVAVLAGLLLAVNAFSLNYAREARTYPFSMLLAAVTTMLLLKAVEGRSRRWWAAFGLAGLLAIGAQPLAATLVLIAQALSLALLPRDRPQWRLAVGVLGGLFVVIGGLALYLSRVQSASTDFITPTTFGQLVYFVDVLTGSRPLTVVYAGLGVVAVIALVRDGLQRGGELWQRALIFCWLVVPPVVLVVVSELRPLWRNRYLIPITPALVILVAFALTRLRPKLLQAGALAVVLALSGVNVHRELQDGPIEDLPAGAELLLQESRSTDAVVYSGAATRTPFLWVLEQQAGDLPLPRDIALAPRGTTHEVRDLFAKEVDAPTLANRLADCGRVWVVSLPAATWHPTPEPMQVVQQSAFWREQFHEIAQHDFGGLRIELYENELETGRHRGGCGEAPAAP